MWQVIKEAMGPRSGDPLAQQPDAYKDRWWLWDKEAGWPGKRTWPVGIHEYIYNEGTVITMCDVFNMRDYGRTE